MACMVFLPSCKATLKKEFLNCQFKILVWVRSVLRTEANRFQLKPLIYTHLSKPKVDLHHVRFGVHRFLYLPAFSCPCRNNSVMACSSQMLLDKNLLITQESAKERKLLRNSLDSLFKFFGRESVTLEEQSPKIKVAVLGAAGHVGEALSYMLKQSPFIDQLALYDLCNTEGIAVDLNFLDTKCEVLPYCGTDTIPDALEDARVVVIAAAAPYKKDRSAEKRFYANAKIVVELVEECTKQCPEALVAILTAPLNSILPVASQTLKRVCPDVENPTRLFGMTTLDVVYANSHLARYLKANAQDVSVPVIGGNSCQTVVPIFSQATPSAQVVLADATRLTRLVQDSVGNSAIDRSSECLPTLTYAFAAARFTISLCKACLGHKGVVECAYIPTSEKGMPAFFATPVEIGPEGLERNHGVPALSCYEKSLLDKACDVLQRDIDTGLKVTNFSSILPEFRDECAMIERVACAEQNS